STGNLERTRVRAVKGSDRFQPGIGAGPRDGQTSTHAETDRAHPVRVDLVQPGEKGQCALQVVDAVAIDRSDQQASHVARHADRPVAVGEEVHRKGGVTRLGESVRDLLDVCVETVRLLTHEDRWVWAWSVRHGQITAALQLTGRDVSCLHVMEGSVEDGSGG